MKRFGKQLLFLFATCLPLMGFEGNVDFLYLKPVRSGLDFAILPVADGKDPLVDLELDWQGAYRLSLSHCFCSAWFLEGRFTHWRTKDKQDAEASDLIATRLPTSFSPPPIYNLAETQLRIRYDVGDLLLGAKRAFCDRSVLLCPFAGARFASIDQKMTTRYCGMQSSNVIFVTSEEKQTMHGYGLLAGMDASYICLCDLLRLYAKGMIGFLYSDFSGSVFIRTSSPPPLIGVEYDHNVQVPFFNLEIGLECWSMECFGEQIAWGIGYVFENYCLEDFFASPIPSTFIRNQAMFGYHGVFIRGLVRF